MLPARPLSLVCQLLLLLLLTSDCHGRGSGAPSDACADLTPRHSGAGAQPQDEFPYMLKVTPTSVHPGGRSVRREDDRSLTGGEGRGKVSDGGRRVILDGTIAT